MTRKLHRRFGRPLATRRAGFSLIEVLVATAIFVLIVTQLAQGLVQNTKARARIEQQKAFLQVEKALRGAAFKKVSSFMEKEPKCNSPKTSFTKLWKSQPYPDLRFELVDKPEKATFPPEMFRRCRSQTHLGRIERGIYFCLEIEGVGSKPRSFLEDNEVFAEAFYGLWDLAKDKPTGCLAFNDKSTKVRGAKLYYTIYWRKKAGTGAGGEFDSYSGVMYGQTHGTE